ncbi:MAG: hypothetical protein JF622_06765, partial [Terrabacter sp.]|nr:hypothetical protein [Terrabacter sp.]
RHDLSLYGKDLDARDADYRGAFLAAVRDYLTELPAELREGLDQPYRLAVRELVDGSTESAVARYNERTDRVTPLPATGYTTGPVDPLSPGSPLWQDTIAVAKVMRRALLDEHAIRFPEGILYEDQPFTVALWSTARRITTLDEVVYHWYVNNVAGEESITARRHEIANVHDRLAANRAIDVQLTRRPDLAPAKLDKFVRHDLSLSATISPSTARTSTPGTPTTGEPSSQRCGTTSPSCPQSCARVSTSPTVWRSASSSTAAPTAPWPPASSPTAASTSTAPSCSARTAGGGRTGPRARRLPTTT